MIDQKEVMKFKIKLQEIEYNLTKDDNRVAEHNRGIFFCSQRLNKNMKDLKETKKAYKKYLEDNKQTLTETKGK